MNEGEKYLRDYLLNKRYLDKDDSDSNGEDEETEKITKKAKKETNKIENTPLDYADFSEEEKEVERQEEFERKYNFRFEDPDPEFIKVFKFFFISKNVFHILKLLYLFSLIQELLLIQ